MKLVYKKSGVEVAKGDAAQTFRHETVIVESWEKPTSPASSGRVHVTRAGNRESLFPSVIGAEWIEREDRENYVPETLDDRLAAKHRNRMM